MKQFVDLNIEIVVGVVISVLERGISEQSRMIHDGSEIHGRVAVACASLGSSVSEY